MAVKTVPGIEGQVMLVQETSTSPYLTGATPVAAGSGNVANASAVATMAATASVTNYISSFMISGSGSTAGLPVTVTVAGLLGGTQSWTYTFNTGVALANSSLTVRFDPPFPASAVNTAIVVTCPAGGAGNTNNTVVALGYRL